MEQSNHNSKFSIPNSQLSCFDEIRPYEAGEMKQAFEDLIHDRQFSLLLKGFAPWLPKAVRNALLRMAFIGVKTPLDFQKRFMKPVVKWIIRRHTDGCTFDDAALSGNHTSQFSVLSSQLEDYVLAHSEPEPEYLYGLWRATNIHTIHGRMASGHLQGRLLKMLVRMIQPRRILEIGTFSGYSAISMAEGLPEGGRLYTFEINDEMEDFTRAWIEGSSVADKIEFIIGDALIEAPWLGITFDMAFIDGDKRHYRDYYEMVLSILRPGGFIIADNTLWDGHVVDHAYDHDHQTQGIIDFNGYVARDARVEQVILPLRDGLTLMRKN